MTDQLRTIQDVAFTGDAKKHPHDQSNNEIGHDLAIARALRSAATYFEGKAAYLIDYADDGASHVRMLDSMTGAM